MAIQSCLLCLHSLSIGKTTSLKQNVSVSMSCRISENKDAILRKYFKALTFDWGVVSYQCRSFWVSGDKAPACDVEDLGHVSSCAWFKANWEHKVLWHTWETCSHCPGSQLHCSIFHKQLFSPAGFWIWYYIYYAHAMQFLVWYVKFKAAPWNCSTTWQV